MERTESIVIQAAPSIENHKIAEMEIFGWNLHGRQEIHEAGDAYVEPISSDSNTYVIKQKVSQYVKLHFTRSLSLPNLDEIRQIESEYFNLPFPPSPSQKGPIGCMAVSLLSLLCTTCGGISLLPMGMSENSTTEALPIFLFLVIVGLVGLVPGIFWYRSNKNKSETTMQICQQSAQRAQELIAQVKPLTMP